MSQQEVLKVLEKTQKEMTSKDIGKILNQGTGSISVSLKKLFKQGLVIRHPKHIVPVWKASSNARPYRWKIR